MNTNARYLELHIFLNYLNNGTYLKTATTVAFLVNCLLHTFDTAIYLCDCITTYRIYKH